MRRCPDCGFRTEDKVCPLCGVKTKNVEIPVHTHSQRGETCSLPNQKPVSKPTVQPPKPVNQNSPQKPTYVRKTGKRKGELEGWQIGLIVVVLFVVLRACGS